jgi:hypothetical protein
LTSHRRAEIALGRAPEHASIAEAAERGIWFRAWLLP